MHSYKLLYLKTKTEFSFLIHFLFSNLWKKVEDVPHLELSREVSRCFLGTNVFLEYWLGLILSEEFSDTNLNYFWNKWWDNLRKRSQLFSRTQLTGRDPKERIKELILDEHTHCGCSCSPYSRNERRVPQFFVIGHGLSLTHFWLAGAKTIILPFCRTTHSVPELDLRKKMSQRYSAYF